MAQIEGPLALVGGDELNPGNEDQDRVLVAAAGSGPAFVLATAAGRSRPEMAVRHAISWFAGLGLALEELPAIRAKDANSKENAERARRGTFFYLVGGDPGKVPATLAGTRVWAAVCAAWRSGAALAGSSAGAMAFGEWTLTRDRRPGDTDRRYTLGLGLLPRTAVIPHFDTFGAAWAATCLASRPDADTILVGIDERTAALWDAGGWRVYGPGSVTVFIGDERATFASGAPIEGLLPPMTKDRTKDPSGL